MVCVVDKDNLSREIYFPCRVRMLENLIKKEFGFDGNEWVIVCVLGKVRKNMSIMKEEERNRLPNWRRDNITRMRGQPCKGNSVN